MTTVVPVILSGGSGTRLWPMSRKHYPKQFLSLTGKNSLLQNTVERAKKITGGVEPVVVSNNDHRFIVAEQLQEIGVTAHAIILEPCARNTAPAIALAAMAIKNPEALMLVLPSDHLIENIDGMKEAVQASLQQAEAGNLVTFGIVPDHAATGFGYIKAAANGRANAACLQVEEFVEKPDKSTAEKYLASGAYFWNSGMFLIKVASYLEALQKFEPGIVSSCESAMANISRDLDFLRVDQQSFEANPDISIDYAVMERVDNAVVTPIDVGWNDVGSWSSLWSVLEQDDYGNVALGDVYTKNTHGCYLRSESKFIATLGIQDLVVVESDDAILVASKDAVQEVKDVVGFLEGENREESRMHRKVFRPWGFYDTVDIGHRHKVKRIMVKPGEKLSLQMHHQRAEHWVVVRGVAKVTKGDETFLLQENQSTFISVGMTHRLENPGNVPLEIIEVQSGAYLGEDDIVRFDDRYGRS